MLAWFIEKLSRYTDAEDRQALIERLGGYPDIDAAIFAIKEKDTPEKIELLTLCVKRLFNTIGADDILKVVQGRWFYKGRALQPEEVTLLQEEAAHLLRSKLWEILQNDLWYQANRKMFLESKSEIDMIAGKLWVFTIDAIRTRLTKMLPLEK